MAEPETPLVLHVDDNETNRYIVGRVLEKSGFKVFSAATGAEGLEFLEREKPDLIILDVKLPDVNGIELCRQIKASAAWSSTPVLQMSAHYTGVAARTEILESGADAYLASSVDPTELTATVRALLRVRRAEEAARNAAREWQATVNSVRDAIFILDEKAHIVRYNRAADAILTKASGSCAGQHITDAVNGMIFPPEATEGRRQAGHRNPVEFQCGTRWYRANVDPILDEEQRRSGFVCVLTDVTTDRIVEAEIRRINDELIAARDEAVRANRAKSAFLASMSHELRTPLNIMIGYTEMLHEDATHHGHEQYLQDLVRIQKAGRHLVDLVTDILDLSKIEAGRMDLHLDSVDVLNMLHELAETIAPLVEQRENTMRLETSGTLGTMWTDPAKLRQVLLNLLSNACKFTSSGVIELSAVRKVQDLRDWVIFSVRDTGVGISEDHLPKLFDEYSQFLRERDPETPGTGLGLAISRRLIEMLGGKIEVESRLGEGSVFTVTIPAQVSG